MALRTTDLKGVTSQASATREAPAQAELRPTCAGAPASTSDYRNATLGYTLMTLRVETTSLFIARTA